MLPPLLPEQGPGGVRQSEYLHNNKITQYTLNSAVDKWGTLWVNPALAGQYTQRTQPTLSVSLILSSATIVLPSSSKPYAFVNFVFHKISSNRYDERE